MIGWMVVVGVVATCLAAEAFFSGAELALIAADRVRLQERAARGGRQGLLIERFLRRPQDLIATSLIGTNLCIVLSSVVVTLYALQSGHEHAELISVAVVTPLVLVFGEIVPKSVFQAHADRLAPRAIVLLWGCYALLSPLVAASSRVSVAILRALGVQERRPFMTREELRLLLKLPDAPAAGAPGAAADGAISEGEKGIITRLFSFRETTVADAMVPLSEVCAVPASATLDDAAREVIDKGYTRIPVYRERVDQIEGVVHAFDLLRAPEGAHLVGDVARPPVFVPGGQSVMETLARLQREHQGMAVVVDEYGGAVGVVTIEDIIEEAVGEIEDEWDRAPAAIRPDGPRAWRVAAATPVAQVNAELKLALPEGEDYQTIGGLVLDRCKHIPRPGEAITLGAVRLEVTAATARAVQEVRILQGR